MEKKRERIGPCWRLKTPRDSPSTRRGLPGLKMRRSDERRRTLFKRLKITFWISWIRLALVLHPRLDRCRWHSANDYSSALVFLFPPILSLFALKKKKISFLFCESHYQRNEMSSKSCPRKFSLDLCKIALIKLQLYPNWKYFLFFVISYLVSFLNSIEIAI